MLNALDRLADGYAGQIDAANQELAIAEGQLRDHEARLGRAFPHDDYLRELTDLRDRLKMGLSRTTPEPGVETVAELAGRIKALKAAHAIDAAPERTATRRIVAEVPVTARIRRRTGPAPGGDSPDGPTEPPEAPPATEAKAPARAIGPDHRQRQADRRRRHDRQQSLF